MTFTRTAVGLSNQKLFLKVDVVVLVEGGSSISIEDVYKGKLNEESIDILFWRGIFNIFLKKKTFKVRAVGSKKNLIKIASDISRGAIKDVFVAMDRDYDHLTGTIISSNGIFYTKGYSWENDVWSNNVIKETILSISLADFDKEKMFTELDEIINQFRKDVRWLIYADMILVINGSSLLPREKPMSIITHNSRGLPSINRGIVLKKIKTKRSVTSINKKISVKLKIVPLSDCPGKIVSCYAYSLICYFINKICKLKTIPRHFIDSFGIQHFHNFLINNIIADIFLYYKNQFDNI